ncbi:hypothetical protein EMIT0111MI5_290029 [Burkholderia sp. IT-111MI5]
MTGLRHIRRFPFPAAKFYSDRKLPALPCLVPVRRVAPDSEESPCRVSSPLPPIFPRAPSRRKRAWFTTSPR